MKKAKKKATILNVMIAFRKWQAEAWRASAHEGRELPEQYPFSVETEEDMALRRAWELLTKGSTWDGHLVSRRAIAAAMLTAAVSVEASDGEDPIARRAYELLVDWMVYEEFRAPYGSGARLAIGASRRPDLVVSMETVRVEYACIVPTMQAYSEHPGATKDVIRRIFDHVLGGNAAVTIGGVKFSTKGAEVAPFVEFFDTYRFL